MGISSVPESLGASKLGASRAQGEGGTSSMRDRFVPLALIDSSRVRSAVLAGGFGGRGLRFRPSEDAGERLRAEGEAQITPETEPGA